MAAQSRRFDAPQPSVAHFHDEAMVKHDASCDLVTKRPTPGSVGLNCTCREGPDSGYDDARIVPMEGPRLEFRRFDASASSNREAALEDENTRLREELSRLKGGGSDIAELSALPLGKMGVIRRGRR